MYRYRVLYSEPELKVTARTCGFVGGSTLAEAIATITSECVEEKNLIEIRLEPLEGLVEDWELTDMIEPEYPKEVCWDSEDYEPLTLN